MTDKELKAKILAEIEKKIKVLSPFIHQGSDTCGKVVRQLESLANFINSLPEEPVSKDLEEAATTFADVHVYATRKICFKAGAQWDRQRTINDAVNFLVKNRNSIAFSDSFIDSFVKYVKDK